MLLEPLNESHKTAVIAILNHYIFHSTAAYRTEPVGEEFFPHFLAGPEVLCSYALVAPEGEVAGFCMLEPRMPLPTFSEVAEVMYFLHPEHTGKGYGTMALHHLEAEARRRGIRKLLADISSENADSIAFHRRHGFAEYGRLEDAGAKFGRRFGLVYMVKDLC